MTKKLLFTLLSIFLSVMTLVGQVTQSVNVSQPGGLSAAIGSNLKTVTDLTLTGTINATDFETIKQMTALQNLNMSKVSVADNTIPANAFQNRVLNSLNLPSSILSIEDLSFYQATIENFDLSSLTKLEKIGHDAFNSFKSHSLDFTKCLNIKEIGYHAFMNLNLTKDILDFSSYSVLPRATIAQSGPSLFSNFGGTVILSPNLKEIPDNSFYQFKGSVALPQGLEKIGNRAFQQSTIKELNLPSSILSIEDLSFYQATIENFDLSSLTKLEKIGHDAFNSFKSHSLDFTKCLNIKEIGYHAFMNLNLTKDILDFSSYSVLPRATIAQSGPSLFSNFGGTVILSPNLKEIPDNSFYQFKGSVALPQGLEKIGNRAFQQSTIKELNLPSSILSIEDLSFYQATIENFDLSSLTKLEKIGHDAFNSFKSHSLDFTKCLNIKEIGYHAFMNLNLTKDILDFSSYSVLPRATIAQSGPSLFSNFGGTVILSPNLKEIPDNSFYQFKGSVALPQGLEKIGNRAFQQSTIKELNLPSSILSIEDLSFYQATIENFDLSSLTKLEKIGHDAFNSFKSHSLDFTKCLNIKEIGYHAFMNLNLTKDILDFSSYSVLPRATIAQSGPSLFSNFGGTVILSPNLKEIPDNSFYQFKGSVALPQGLEKIGNRAFQQSTLKSIELPSSVTKIENNAFLNASQLEKIISNNPTPPALGNNVFGGMNRETTVLEIPKQSVNLYGTADQWKDFLNVKSTIPSKLKLLYKISARVWPDGIFETDNLEIPYEGVRIGEYYWMNTNFNHIEPNRQNFSANPLSLKAGVENQYPFTQKQIDEYLDFLNIDKSQFQVDIDQFRSDFGHYYGSATRSYMTQWGRMYENNSSTNNSDWNLPSIKDYRQLIAMSDFRHYAVKDDTLRSRDVLYTFAAKRNSNVMSEYVLTTGCLDHTGNAYTTTDWYGLNGVTNKYGFSLMLGGARYNEVRPGVNEQWYTANCDGTTLTHEWTQTGGLYHLFYTTELAASDGFFNLHDYVDTNTSKSDHWQHIRWCRPLTAEELGYRLYINIPNVSKESAEWQSLQSGDELPLLIKYRYSDLDRSKVSILKLGLNESAPAGYIELPHGYLRGFYVHYLLDNPSPEVDIAKVVSYACQVQDGVLMKNRPANVAPGTNNSESLLDVPTTRSLSVDDVVIPFRTSSEVRIYPNPVQDVLNVSGEGVEKISLYDLSGRQLQSVSNASSIQMSGLTVGTYIVRVQTASGESVHKVMKK